MTPEEYYARGSDEDWDHDQTSRLNKQLASAMLSKMGESPARRQGEKPDTDSIDAAVMTAAEVEAVVNSRANQ